VCGPAEGPVSGVSIVTAEVDHGAVVQKFACALVAGDFLAALALLDADLALRTSPESLEGQLSQMVDHGEGPPEYAHHVAALAEWPDRLEGDAGWAYSSIVGPGYSEAIAGVVTKEGRIRQLEWGKAAAQRRLGGGS
jgi:hypothetical protein